MIKCNNSCPLDKFNACCVECPHIEDCPEKCEFDPKDCGESTTEQPEQTEGASLEVFQAQSAAIINNIAGLVKQKAEIEAAEKSMREQLQAAMEAHGIEKVDHDILKINYIKPTTRTSVDSKKLQSSYPRIYDECAKTSNVKGYVKIELKGAKK